ncbi:DUF3310 domain-containing protein [Streptomyces sp. NPDC056638]|uniref:DUF3310 domain-containing protein n=1 Tax=Streptomyces sp. NPDC056638 TaxID=3345887 RepID=UPI00367687B1
MTFKVGTKVTITNQTGYPGHKFMGRSGEIVCVDSNRSFPYEVKLDGTTSTRSFAASEMTVIESVKDSVNHPAHYTWLPKGLEVIDLTECLNFNKGNAVKYLCRAGRKEDSPELQDLEKALWYINREISRIKKDTKNV